MNQSGIYPKGQRVLIKPDKLSETLGSTAFIVPEEVLKNHQMAQQAGVLIEIGDEAWIDYRQAFAKVGERVMYDQYAGKVATGADGEEYRVMNDVDIIASIDDNVFFDLLKPRKPLTGAA